VQVIGIIAKHNMVLETGHNSPAEVLLLVREGKRQGVRNILVTHATNEYPGLSVDQVKEVAQLGAYSEFVWSGAQGAGLANWIKAIRAAGPAWCVISSDLGQPNNPLHPDGLLELYKTLKAQGFSDAEVAQMSQTNPARLLGLAP
jgi:microsomal dipeptidase-like Zn-dependent dipeptidase